MHVYTHVTCMHTFQAHTIAKNLVYSCVAFRKAIPEHVAHVKISIETNCEVRPAELDSSK